MSSLLSGERRLSGLAVECNGNKDENPNATDLQPSPSCSSWGGVLASVPGCLIEFQGRLVHYEVPVIGAAEVVDSTCKPRNLGVIYV